MSIITKLLRDYSQIRISYEVAGKDPSAEIAKTLKQLADELAKNEWRCPPTEVPTDAIAMGAFYEMFALKIGSDAPIMLCYYYSSRVANDQLFPTNVRALGNKFRAFIVAKAINKLNMVFNLACNAPIGGYRGKLRGGQQFFDLALTSDIYKAWDTDNGDPLLQSLKRQAPMVASNYPTYTKQQIISEGELAHEAVLNIVKSMLKLD